MGFKYDAMFANVGDALLWEENTAKLLGILIDRDLSFNDHVKMICKKASQKLAAISRLANILSKDKRKLLIRTFFESQFNYCPLIWIFCGRTANNKINRLHKRALRIAYPDFESTFEDGSVTIDQRNLRALAIEMYKVSNKLSPPFMSKLFTEHNTRSNVHTINRYSL